MNEEGKTVRELLCVARTSSQSHVSPNFSPCQPLEVAWEDDREEMGEFLESTLRQRGLPVPQRPPREEEGEEEEGGAFAADDDDGVEESKAEGGGARDRMAW